MLVGLLGILKAGGTYIPLDPAFPEERLTFMLEDAEVNFLIVDSKTSPLTPLIDKERGTIIINVDSDWELITQQPTHSPPRHRGVGGICLYYLHFRFYR